MKSSTSCLFPQSSISSRPQGRGIINSCWNDQIRHYEYYFVLLHNHNIMRAQNTIYCWCLVPKVHLTVSEKLKIFGSRISDIWICMLGVRAAKKYNYHWLCFVIHFWADWPLIFFSSKNGQKQLRDSCLRPIQLVCHDCKLILGINF